MTAHSSRFLSTGLALMVFLLAVPGISAGENTTVKEYLDEHEKDLIATDFKTHTIKPVTPMTVISWAGHAAFDPSAVMGKRIMYVYDPKTIASSPIASHHWQMAISERDWGLVRTDDLEAAVSGSSVSVDTCRIKAKDGDMSYYIDPEYFLSISKYVLDVAIDDGSFILSDARIPGAEPTRKVFTKHDTQ